MSVADDPVGCTGCNYEGFISHRPMWLVYRIPGNHYFKTGRQTGWCVKCNAVRDIEPEFRQYPAKDELRQLNDRIFSLSFKIWRWLYELVSPKRPSIVTRAAELERTIWLAKARKCDPRCLSCGSELTVPLKFNDREICTTFIHSCGGRLRRMPERDSGIRFSVDTEVIYLDPKGKRVSGDGLSLPDLDR